MPSSGPKCKYVSRRKRSKSSSREDLILHLQRFSLTLLHLATLGPVIFTIGALRFGIEVKLFTEPLSVAHVRDTSQSNRTVEERAAKESHNGRGRGNRNE